MQYSSGVHCVVGQMGVHGRHGMVVWYILPNMCLQLQYMQQLGDSGLLGASWVVYSSWYVPVAVASLSSCPGRSGTGISQCGVSSPLPWRALSPETGVVVSDSGH